MMLTTFCYEPLLYTSTNILSSSLILPTIIFQQLHIAFNNFIALSSYCMNMITWPFKFISMLTIRQALVPLLLFLTILMRKPPNPLMDF